MTINNQIREINPFEKLSLLDHPAPMNESRKRHIAKTITWRILASATTFALALIFFHDDKEAVSKASGVALAESVIKMFMYYFHERIWYRSNFGLDKSKRKSK